MTISGDTVCNLIKSFPILLIMAQNAKKCLETPLYYKPPSPTQSPEYYQALDALFHALFVQECPQGYGHGYGNGYGPYYDGKSIYGHANYGQGKPCGNSYGYDTSHYPQYPVYGYKKSNIYNITSGVGYGSANHVYAVNNHKYKVVVRKQKYGKRRPEKLQGYVPQHRHHDNALGPGREVITLESSISVGDRRFPNFFIQGPRNNYNPYEFTSENRGDYRPNFDNRGDERLNFDNNYRPNFYNPGNNRPNFDNRNDYRPNFGNRGDGRPNFDNNYRPDFQNGGNNRPNFDSAGDYRPNFDNRPYYRPNFDNNDTPNFDNKGDGKPNFENKGDDRPNFGTIEDNRPNFDNRSYDEPNVDTTENNRPNFDSKDDNRPNFDTRFSEINAGDHQPSGLIHIPGNSQTEGGFVFPDSEDDQPEKEPVIAEDRDDNLELPSEPPPKPTEEMSTTKLPDLTPVPTVRTDSRNGFFGNQQSCDTAAGGVGSCIVLTSCESLYSRLRVASSDPALVQELRKAHCGFDGNTPKVCCPRLEIPTAPPPPPPSPRTEPPTPPSLPPTDVDDGRTTLPDPPECGFSNASLSRVVGGVAAKLGDFPWMALLGYKGRGAGAGPRWLCGGSLVSSRHVLTAAHCIHRRENDLYLVRLGELDLNREDEGATPTDILISRQIKHEEYSPTAFTNDIGLLVLSRNVHYTPLIRPICLPAESELRARSYENYNPIIAGWGDTEFRGPAATHLQALQLPVVSNDFCATAYAAYKAQQIDERVLCAGYKRGGRDACQGDSGGPLMQPIWNPTTYKTYFYQIGVVSFGKKCAEAGFPGVYTRVTHFIPWLQSKITGQ